jgi:hypothetical protein
VATIHVVDMTSTHEEEDSVKLKLTQRAGRHKTQDGQQTREQRIHKEH